MANEKLISASALANVIRDDPYIHGRAYARVRDHIDDAPAVDVMKWIPVTERLPEENDDVLCYRGNHIGVLMDVYTYKGDNKWEDTYGNWNYGDLEGITHWMPLPEAPKGE